MTSNSIPTPGPWVVRGQPFDSDATETEHVMGIDPATNDTPGGWPYLIRQDRKFNLGETPLHIATGVQGLADARLMAAAPDMLAMLKLALSYVGHPDVRAIPFALNSGCVAERIERLLKAICAQS